MPPLLPTRNSILPTHTALTDLLLKLLPPHALDNPLLYHTPRHKSYNPSTTPITDLILSITPTPGIYTLLHHLSPPSFFTSNLPPLPSVTSEPGPFKTLSSDFRIEPIDIKDIPILQRAVPAVFLHRPWTLNRSLVPKGTLITTSHKRFDEVLTTGYNLALASNLNLQLDDAVCIEGYKGDPERKIGIVARLEAPQRLESVVERVKDEFMFDGGQRLGEECIQPVTDIDGVSWQDQANDEISVVAIMNAFGADEVARVIVAATEAGFVERGGYAKILYVTGEPKEDGVECLTKYYPGMKALCVGHREAEEWGIRWLGRRIREEWQDLRVWFVVEEEEVIEKPKKAVESKPKGKKRKFGP